jgi:hypothetical protein
MIKEIPEFVHKKRYSNFYLFSDSEIILNKGFSERIRLFSKKVNGNNLIIELKLNEELSSFIHDKVITIPNDETNSLERFYNQSVIIDKGSTISYFSLDFYLYDNNGDWELFCSFCQEIAIIGCNGNIVSDFLSIIKPYAEQSFEEKMNSMGNFFKHKNDKMEYIYALKKSYKFSN